MGILEWIRSFRKDGTISLESMPDDELNSIIAEIHIRELAFFSCVNMIGNAISKCEIKTFVNNVETKGPEWYLWNVSPNKNQNSSSFMHKLIYQLYKNNDCLVVEEAGQLLVADYFNMTEYALYDNVFDGVTVGDFTFAKRFNMSEVMYFKLSEKNMRSVINGIYESYGKLITYGMKSYQKSRGNRGVLDYETIGQGDENAKKNFDDLMNNRFKKYFTAENAVLPLPKGYKYTESTSKTYSSEGTRDIRAMADDIRDFTAEGLNIPPALARGDIAGIADAMTSFLTFCIDPLTDNISEEANRKRSGLSGMTKGHYIKIDTRAILHVDVLSLSTAIDKLIGSGAYSINEIRKLTGDEPIDEPWANQHFITKNYSTVEEALASLGLEANTTK